MTKPTVVERPMPPRYENEYRLKFTIPAEGYHPEATGYIVFRRGEEDRAPH
jgi:hypothetical protein